MTGIIIQARMGSSRLPGKILKDFEGRTLLGHILYRLERVHNTVDIVMATSDQRLDDNVEVFCNGHKVKCFRGDENNVLKRYYDCAVTYGFDQIVRMTGDNPLPDIEELDRLIEFHLEKGNDFSENFSVLPIGVGMEMISFQALEESMSKAFLPKHFEHADEYILDHLADYQHGTLSVQSVKNKPEVRLTVDTQEDYEKMCYILREADAEYVTTEQAIALSNLYESKRKQRKEKKSECFSSWSAF